MSALDPAVIIAVAGASSIGAVLTAMITILRERAEQIRKVVANAVSRDHEVTVIIQSDGERVKLTLDAKNDVSAIEKIIADLGIVQNVERADDA